MRPVRAVLLRPGERFTQEGQLRDYLLEVTGNLGLDFIRYVAVEKPDVEFVCASTQSYVKPVAYGPEVGLAELSPGDRFEWKDELCECVEEVDHAGYLRYRIVNLEQIFAIMIPHRRVRLSAPRGLVPVSEETVATGSEPDPTMDDPLLERRLREDLDRLVGSVVGLLRGRVVVAESLARSRLQKNTELKLALDTAEQRVRDLEAECAKLRGRFPDGSEVKDDRDDVASIRFKLLELD